MVVYSDWRVAQRNKKSSAVAAPSLTPTTPIWVPVDKQAEDKALEQMLLATSDGETETVSSRAQ